MEQNLLKNFYMKKEKKPLTVAFNSTFSYMGDILSINKKN